MEIKIPEDLKANVPQSKWGKILMATPVAMTVLATLLAGLSSSEMTSAQYVRSLAAQQQSKAGDQWSYFQAKRLRGAIQHSTLDILQHSRPVRPFDAGHFRQSVVELAIPSDQSEAMKARAELLVLIDSSEGQQVLKAMQNGQLAEIVAGQVSDKQVKDALDAIENMRPEPEITALVAPIKVGALTEMLRGAVDRARTFDMTLKQFTRTVDRMESLVLMVTVPLTQTETAITGNGLSLNRDFTAARIRYQELRYDAESRLNQTIANLYELQVRQSNILAERHHNRSLRFFVGMLAAQAGVVIATLSIAAQKRSLLWLLASTAGLAAVAFSVYVYFCN